MKESWRTRAVTSGPDFIISSSNPLPIPRGSNYNNSNNSDSSYLPKFYLGSNSQINPLILTLSEIAATILLLFFWLF